MTTPPSSRRRRGRTAEPVATARRSRASQAFQLRHDLPELRMLDVKPIGIETGTRWGAMPPLLPLPSNPGPAVGEIVLKPNEKLIDPDAADGTPNVYRSLTKALPNLQPGDVRAPQARQEEPRRRDQDAHLDDPKAHPHVQALPRPPPRARAAREDPAPRRRPVPPVRRQAAFREPRVPSRAGPAGVHAQSVVALASNGSVSFKNCAITLRQTDSKIPLSAVTFLDPDDVTKMSMMSNRSHAQVQLTGCLVRGEGDLVTVRGTGRSS